MGIAWLAAWVAIDHWQSQPDPQFFAGGIPLLAWYALAILGLAAVLRWRARPAPAFGPALALAMGMVPVPLLFASVAAVLLDTSWFPVLALIVGVYALLYLARGLRAMTGETQRAAACVGLLFIAGFGWVTDALDVIPDVWNPAESQTTRQDDPPADSEALLFGQSGRIDQSPAGPATRRCSRKRSVWHRGCSANAMPSMAGACL